MVGGSWGCVSGAVGKELGSPAIHPLRELMAQVERNGVVYTLVAASTLAGPCIMHLDMTDGLACSCPNNSFECNISLSGKEKKRKYTICVVPTPQEARRRHRPTTLFHRFLKNNSLFRL
jgi:hypothetical protein